MFRSATNGDTNELMAWEEETLPDKPGPQEWTDEFSADAKVARKTASRTRMTEADDDGTKDVEVVSLAANDRFNPDQEITTEFVISDEDEPTNQPQESLERPSSTALAAETTAAAPPASVIAPGDRVIAQVSAEIENDMDDDDLEVDLDHRQLFADLSDALASETGLAVTASHHVARSNPPMVEPADFAVPLDVFEVDVPPSKDPFRSANTTTENENGFFRNIFIDHPGTSGKRGSAGNAKDYSEIRRRFHHPDTSTQFRSHSRFSRQFQRPSKEE